MPRILAAAALLCPVLAADAAATPPTAVFACGDMQVEARMEGEALLLRLSGQETPLRRSESASGARWAGSGADGAIVFWDRGTQALLTRGGGAPVVCRRTDPPGFAYRALGQEPPWILRIEGERMILSRGYERAETIARAAPPRTTPEGTLHESAPGEPPIALLVSPGPCRDSMSGAPFPDRARLTHAGQALEGCGSTPEGRLLGAAWTVTALGGEDPAGRRPVTLEFLEGGAFGGQGPCNRFRGQWRMEGERLLFGPVASTMMACPDPAMAKERQLFRLFETLSGHRFTETGALMLEGADGVVLEASR